MGGLLGEIRLHEAPSGQTVRSLGGPTACSEAETRDRSWYLITRALHDVEVDLYMVQKGRGA